MIKLIVEIILNFIYLQIQRKILYRKKLLLHHYFSAAFSNAQTTWIYRWDVRTPNIQMLGYWRRSWKSSKPTRPFTQGFPQTLQVLSSFHLVSHDCQCSFGISVEGGFNNIKSDESSVEFDNKLFIALVLNKTLGNFCRRRSYKPFREL
jgi:hypothetical protein